MQYVTHLLDDGFHIYLTTFQWMNVISIGTQIGTYMLDI